MKALLPIALFATTWLAGCSQSPQPAASGQNPTSAPSSIATRSPAQEAVNPGCEFCAVPATVKRCDVSMGVRTTLFWDFSSKGIDEVVIYVVDKKTGLDQHFGTGPAKGSKVSGPWLSPGLQFKVKDAKGVQLGALTIDGVDC